MSDPIVDGESPGTDATRQLGQEGLGPSAPLLGYSGRSTLIWRWIAVVGAVFGSGVLATTELPRLGARSLWMLPGTIAVAAMVRWGSIQWVAVFAGGLALELTRGLDLPEALVIAACNPLGVLLIVLILKRGNFDPGFSHRRDVPLFIGATLIGQAPPAVLGTLMLAIQYPVVDLADQMAWNAIDVIRWWLNNVFGTLLLAPLLIAMNRASFAALVKRKLAASLCIATAILIAVLVVLPPPLLADSGAVREPILALSAALVIVSCLRLGFVPTASLAAVLAVIEALSYSFQAGASWPSPSRPARSDRAPSTPRRFRSWPTSCRAASAPPVPSFMEYRRSRASKETSWQGSPSSLRRVPRAAPGCASRSTRTSLSRCRWKIAAIFSGSPRRRSRMRRSTPPRAGSTCNSPRTRPRSGS